MMVKQHMLFTLYSICGIVLKDILAVSVAATKNKVRGAQGQVPLVQNMTVTEGGTANLTCRVEHNDNTSLQWSNPAQQTLFFGDKKALRDNRIELVRATSQELTISISEVSLSDEGLYTCSLFTMPVKTAKAFLTVLGVPKKPEINGLTKPVLEGDHITLTCVTSGSKPAADVRWFKNEMEVKGAKEVNASGKTFTVKSSLRLHVNRDDDGVAYTCRVDHVALTATHEETTQVLEVHYAPYVEIRQSTNVPQEGQYLKLQCVPKGNPSPDPVLWTKDGGELPDMDRMIVDGRDLTFTSLNKTDNGTYRCGATNHLGTSHAEFKLVIYDPNELKRATDHALIGGIVAVVVFATLCLIIVLGRYLARHKGTYLTNEAKGADDAPDADTAIINADGNHAHAEEKKEYFI
ncbi:cell adhesion molecule 2a precursor [Danio rerio]|uniref:Cell adhesion molecule 2a n=1 Tax=Danio rerio TaxID=7955 RepID=Q6PFK4_DANRE|nr:cell adhesion molecule 2a precursor [Danio rerio]AAH57517.1 Cell adhesion molecule 2a [Danio rerio]CAM73226.1 igsf4d [Danio rerio]|eukprot:NP_956958.1 cell adhesion molecule 2a precursor [Danio rerio]